MHNQLNYPLTSNSADILGVSKIYIKFFKEMKYFLSKDKLKWSKATVKTFVMLQKISILL